MQLNSPQAMEFALNRPDAIGTDDSWPPRGAQEFLF
jgi:hypothetical protein